MLLLAAFNPRPSIALRLLTGRSQALPLGVWLAAGGAGGALLSALATSLALWDGSRRASGVRQATGDVRNEEPWVPPRRGQTSEPEPAWDADRPVAQDPWPQAGPQRPPGEPPPTVSVPFRVIRRAHRSGEAVASATPVTDRSGSVNAADDGWQAAAADEDW